MHRNDRDLCLASNWMVRNVVVQPGNCPTVKGESAATVKRNSAADVVHTGGNTAQTPNNIGLEYFFSFNVLTTNVYLKLQVKTVTKCNKMKTISAMTSRT